MAKMVHRFVLIAGLALANPLIAAQTQPRAGASEAEIVIEGRKERQRQIRRFVGSLTETHFRGQIPRFEWKVCPVALGMPDDQNRRFVERMRRVARAAGVPLDEPGCAANAIVIVTPEKPATMRMLRREYPELFRTELDERIRPDRMAPISAWQVQGRLTQDGLAVPVVHDDMGTYYRSEVTRASSRISPANRPHFKATVLVAQLDALRGLTLTQFADYAAMRIFAQTDPSRLDRSTVPTILNIIDTPMGAEIPVTLTQWDLSFLRALYGSTVNRYAEQQRQEMRRRLERDLDDGQRIESE
jgi:hypothetical protein